MTPSAVPIASSKSDQKVCSHCGLEVPQSRKANKEVLFCCSGCEYVYQIIHGLGLERFYNLREERGMSPASPVLSPFVHFDGPEFEELYIKNADNGKRKLTFVVSGMYCAACVWLIESLPQVLEGVLGARVNFGNSRVSIVFDPSLATVPQIAQALDSLGYTPRPVLHNSVENEKRFSDRMFLARLAIAGVSAGNVMMIAVSLYQGFFSGIEEKYSLFFQWISLFVAAPAVFFSAAPFYRAALAGLRLRKLHIDLPISLGIVVGFFASVFNTVRGYGHVYYDSICMLIFLLLVGRWFQRKSITQAFESTDLIYSLLPSLARKKSEKGIVEVFSGSLVAGDEVIVEEDELIAADGVVLEGSSPVDCSILTGESRPQTVSPGACVYAGSKNLGDSLAMRVTEGSQKSRLGSLLDFVEANGSKKSNLVRISDQVSQYFVFVIIFLSAGTAAYAWSLGGFALSLERTLALLVISCPCALGLSAPLAYAAALRKAAHLGIFIRGEDVLERLAQVRRVYLDKTGTLTRGEMHVGKCAVFGEGEWCGVVSMLEEGSKHPIGKALKLFVDKNFASDFSNFISSNDIHQVHGKGVWAVDQSGVIWRLGSWSWIRNFVEGNLSSLHCLYDRLIDDGLSPVVLIRDAELYVVFGVGDVLRDGSKLALEQIEKIGACAYLISGDVPELVASFAKQLSFPPERAQGGLSPEEKLSIVQQSESEYCTAMVGDGVNDAAALKAAGVGIGIGGGADACVQVADVFLGKSPAENLSRIFLGAHRTQQIVKRNIAFSLVYNLLGISAAIAGLVNPLFAAILMPVSSVSVVFSSAFGKTFQ